MDIETLTFVIDLLLTLVLLLVLSVIMVRKRLNRELPIFFFFLVFSYLSSVIALTLLRTSFPLYCWSTYIGSTLERIFFFVVIMEIFCRIIAPYNAIRRLARTSLILSSCVLLPLALAFGRAETQTSGASVLIRLIVETLRTLYVMQLGTVLVFLVFAKYLRIRWKSFEFGIILGFGIEALLSTPVHTLMGFYGRRLPSFVTTIAGPSYCFVVLTWIYYALQPEDSLTAMPPVQSQELEQWDHSLSRLLGWQTTSQ
jgi:hypothetical protein